VTVTSFSNLPKRICITGGSGFIGRYFCEQFAHRGISFTILDLHAPGFDLPAGCTYIRGDVRDPAAVNKAMAGCDALLALAAAHHDFGIAEKTFYDVNEMGSQNLCHAMDALAVTEACFYSSVAVFGDVPEPRREDTPKNPDSPYGGSKLKGEAVFERWVGKGGGRRCFVIRPTVTFGPRNFANMYSLIRQVHSGKFLSVGDGKNVKSLAYVENIVAATLFLWERMRSSSNGATTSGFEIFNYVDKPDLSSNEIVSTIRGALGKKPSRVRLPLWLGVLAGVPFDVVIKLTGKNLPVSTARIRKLCAQTKFEADKVRTAGYVPGVSLTEGIQRMVKWYLAEGQHQQAAWHVPPDEVVRG
jgi:nucleoside-diphosphate-sugar epimerase